MVNREITLFSLNQYLPFGSWYEVILPSMMYSEKGVKDTTPDFFVLILAEAKSGAYDDYLIV